MTVEAKNGLRQRLRDETREMHSKTEAASPLMHLFRGKAWDEQIADRYKNNLIAQGNLIEFVTKNRDLWMEETPSLKALAGTLNSLRKDLNDAQHAFTLPEIENSKPVVIGVGYVLLGSSMGSQVILDKIGAGIPDNQRAFMQAMADVSVNFRAFCAELELIEESDHDKVIEGAGIAFNYLGSYS
ncbi:MAG: hypothetical protein GC181_05670 [Bacteroidetes bacterium]|nr:hypothetical protein [Bacteroidota bacterium]